VLGVLTPVFFAAFAVDTCLVATRRPPPFDLPVTRHS